MSGIESIFKFMKAIILCGGKGIRLKDFLEPMPKALVRIGHRPMIWHIMKIFSKFGINEFILALGERGDMIRDYFLNYDFFTNDVTIELGAKNIVFSSQHQEKNWKITFVDTGEDAGTGARVLRCQDYVNGQDFFVTYSDCLSDVKLDKVLEQHRSSGHIATITGVLPPFRYGEFVVEDNQATDYHEVSRLKSLSGWVNGGFMVFSPDIFNYLEPYNECVLEKNIFLRLVRDKQLGISEHVGFWQCLDNDREFNSLNQLCSNNSACWLF